MDTKDETVVTGVTPYVNVEGASEASTFYQQAFAAKEITRMPAQDGKRLMHCHLVINGGPLLISDTFPEHGHNLERSKSFTMHLQVADPQMWWDRAVAAGVEVVMPMQVMFWGDRYGIVRDPYGVQWSVGGPAEAA